jgi:hypothetical protein
MFPKTLVPNHMSPKYSRFFLFLRRFFLFFLKQQNSKNNVFFRNFLNIIELERQNNILFFYSVSSKC